MGQLPGGSFGAQLQNFQRKVAFRERAVFVGTATEVLRSIQEGSEITGAPGQPVDTGNLRASWNIAFPDENTAVVSTNVEYAPEIEDNTRGASLRSAVGGFHSVKITRAGFDRIVASEVKKVRDA